MGKPVGRPKGRNGKVNSGWDSVKGWLTEDEDGKGTCKSSSGANEIECSSTACKTESSSSSRVRSEDEEPLDSRSKCPGRRGPARSSVAGVRGGDTTGESIVLSVDGVGNQLMTVEGISGEDERGDGPGVGEGAGEDEAGLGDEVPTGSLLGLSLLSDGSGSLRRLIVDSYQGPSRWAPK